MYNEEELVEKYCTESINTLSILENRYDFEIILVNDGSKDKTFDRMRSVQKKDAKHFSLVNLTRNFGLEGAVNAGLQVATGEAVVVMDADLQDLPLIILEMVRQWEDGADIVVAVRSERIHDTIFKRLGADFFYKTLDFFSGKVKIKQGAANFRLLSRQALDVLNSLPESNKIFRVTVPYIGMKTAYVEYTRDKRFAGKTKYKLKNMVPYALDSITSISVLPLRMVPILIFISGIVFIISTVLSIFSDNVYRIVFIVSSLVSLFFVMLFICLSIIAEYIAQIMIEVKKRPLSLIYQHTPSGNASNYKGV
jgi:dolichol-phosphate mannosyltransferase